MLRIDALNIVSSRLLGTIVGDAEAQKIVGVLSLGLDLAK